MPIMMKYIWYQLYDSMKGAFLNYKIGLCENIFVTLTTNFLNLHCKNRNAIEEINEQDKSK